MNRNMNLDTLQRVLNKLFASGGNTIIHGSRAYMLYKAGHAAWISWIPADKYRANQEQYDGTPVGWYALLRIA